MHLRAAWTTQAHPYVASGALADSLASLDPTLIFDVTPGSLNGFGRNQSVPVQVWALIMLDDTSASTKLTVASYANSQLANPRYTVEYGSSGYTITQPPATNAQKRRWVFCGTLLLDTGEEPEGTCTIGLAVQRSAGLEFSIDEVMMIPADRVVSTPFGETYGNVAVCNAPVRKIQSDGSVRRIEVNSANGLARAHADPGMFGAQIALDPNKEHEFLAFSGILVANDPTALGLDEENGGAGGQTSVHVEVQPRLAIGGE